MPGWDASAAGWKKWWGTFEKGAQQLSDRLVELAEIRPGQHVLDIATGIGEPAVTAARAGARVTAIDQSPEMLAVARERVRALDLQNIEFREMDAEAADFPEKAFDAALCRWGLMFLADLTGSLAKLRRLLVPGGRLAAAVWGDPSRVPLISIRKEVIARTLPEPPGAPDASSAFALADRSVLERAFVVAGFTPVHTESVLVDFEFSSAEAYSSFQRDVAGPRIAGLAGLPAERQVEVWQAVAEAARRYAAPDGRLCLSNECICAVASAQS